MWKSRLICRTGFILLEPLTWALIGIAYMTAAFWGFVWYSAECGDCANGAGGRF